MPLQRASKKVLNSTKKSRESLNIGQNYRDSIEVIKEYAIFMLDKSGNILSWGQGAQKQLGYKEAEVIGKNFDIFFTSEDIKGGVPGFVLKKALAKGKHIFQGKYVHRNGKALWSGTVLTAFYDKARKHSGFSVVMQNITGQIKKQNASIHQSMHDFLTGLPNRRFLEEDLAHAIEENKGKHLLAVLFLDFNNFKRINDLGHKYGDDILKAISKRLSENTRKQDTVARLGGDEFIMLLKDFNNIEDISRLADKTIKLFRKMFIIGKKKLKVTVSIGVSIYPRDGSTVSDLLHHSDMALYQAKKNGGNRFEFYKEVNTKKPS